MMKHNQMFPAWKQKQCRLCMERRFLHDGYHETGKGEKFSDRYVKCAAQNENDYIAELHRKLSKADDNLNRMCLMLHTVRDEIVDAQKATENIKQHFNGLVEILKER